MGIIVGYVLVFFLLARESFEALGYDSGEIGAANNLLWWVVHGRPFRLSVIGDLSYLGIHVELFWLLLTPIYALLPGPHTLLFLQTIALGLTALPVYLIVRWLWENERAAVLIGSAFLFFPSIAAGNLNQVHPVAYVPVLVVSAVYLFLRERWGWFLVFASLACLVRENVALGVSMFGIWAWVQRRPWKWRLIPLLGCGGYVLVAVGLIIPTALQGQPWRPGSYFSYLGATPGVIVLNAVTQPGLVLSHLFSGENIQYFVFLVQPLAWTIPFGHWAALLAAPDLALNLLSDNSGMKVVGWHYQFLTSTGLYIGALFTMKRIMDWLRKRGGDGGGGYPVLFATATLMFCLAHWFLWFQPQKFKAIPQREALLRAVAVVPPDKSVLVPDRLKGHVSSREHYDGINRFMGQQREYVAQFEYVILDANERQYPPIITREFFDTFRNNPKYQLVFAEQNVFVFQRLGGESDWKVQPVGLGP